MRFCYRLAVLILLAAFVVRGERWIESNSQTFDEANHIASGLSYLRTGDFRLNIEDPPLWKLVWALPLWRRDDVPFSPDAEAWARGDAWTIGNDFLYDSPLPSMEILGMCRRMNLFVGFVLIVCLNRVAHRLAGRMAALAATAFACLDPVLLSLASILSTDLGLSLTTFLTFAAIREYLDRPTRGGVLRVGVCLGLCLASKFSSVFVLSTILVLLIARRMRGGWVGLPGSAGSSKDSLAAAMRIGLIALLTLSLCYFGWRLPDWGAGLKQQLVRNTFDPPSFYLFGEISSVGWWWYFPVCLAIKIPLPILLLAPLGIVRTIRRRRAGEIEYALAAPLLFLSAMVACRVNLGVRVVLPVVVFMYLWAGIGIASLPRRWSVAVLSIAVVWMGTSAIRNSRAELSWVNETVGSERAIEVLGDSNLDWGQDLIALREWMERNEVRTVALSYAGTAPPEAYGIRYRSLPGWGGLRPPMAEPDEEPKYLAVSVSNLQGIYLADSTLYRYRMEEPPISTLRGGIRIYRLP